MWIFIITGSYRFIYNKLEIAKKPVTFILIQCIAAIIIMSFLDYWVRFNFNVWIFATFDINVQESGIYSDKLSTDPYLSKIFTDVYKNGQWSKFMAYAIWVTTYNFYQYTSIARNTAIEKLKIENQLKEAELINLRSQLNPHFLFNSLNSIHSLALTQSGKASEAVLLLSDLMRYTLNYEKRDLVTLEEELEVVTKYIGLEKIRFGKRLEFFEEVDPMTLNEKIPPIIIQTLTENAIKHSISQNTEGGRIHIKTYFKDKLLFIEIRNTGQLKNMDTNPEQGGIGIENTRKRLNMIWGNQAELILKNEGNEVLAQLKIPHFIVA